MTTTTSAPQIDLKTVAELAAQLRVDSIRSSTSAGSGHPTSSMSAADAYPDRYFEMFIAEQQLVAAATGLAVRGYKPFALTLRRS